MSDWQDTSIHTLGVIKYVDEPNLKRRVGWVETNNRVESGQGITI